MSVDLRDLNDILPPIHGGFPGGVNPGIRTTNLADLTAFLDLPKVIAYGTVGPVAGNVALLHELSDKKKVAFIMNGQGPWDSLLYLAANRKAIALPDTARVHFHQGYDGTIGGGLAATSTGPDQGVDAFWADLPGGLSKTTFSQYSWTAVKLDPDPGAPTADFELIAHYRALLCRIFDNTGVQTAFQWTDNPAWWIADFLIRKFIKRGARANEPLTPEEKARFNWQSFVDAAAWCDADIGGGVKRWSKGGIWFADDMDAQAALEKLLLYCQCFHLEINGVLTLIPDESRTSEFTFYAQDIEAGSFKADESDVEGLKNRFVGKFRDLNLASGSSEEQTRYSEATVTLDHKAHQIATGARGSGLSVIPSIEEATFDFGVCTQEHVYRRLRFELWRQLGDDVAPGEVYKPPLRAEWIGSERTIKVLPGTRVTVDKGISEEHGDRDYEVLEPSVMPDGRIRYQALEWIANAFSDSYPAQQGGEAPAPGAGLDPTDSVDAGGNTYLDPDKYVNSAVREESTTARSGQTTSTSWTSVSSFTKKITQPITFKGPLTCTKIQGPASAYGPASASGVLSGGAWSSPGNVFSSDDNRATHALDPSDTSSNLDISFASLSIPAGETVLSWKVEIERHGSGPDIKDVTVQMLKSGALTGNNKADLGAFWPGADAYKSYDYTAAQWGGTWVSTDFNGNAGLRIACKNDGGAGTETARIDHVRITVVTDGGTYTMKARLRVGSQVSAEVSISQPTSSDTQEVSIPGVNPSSPGTPTVITVEVQAQVTTLTGGTVEASFDDVKYTDQAPANIE